MNDAIFRFSLLSILILAAGCAINGPNGAIGTGGGVMAGSLLGAAIGASEGKAPEGAIIGGLAGATAGNLIGNSLDNQVAREQAISQSRSMLPAASGLNSSKIVEMSQNGLGDDIIVNQLRVEGVAIAATPDDLIELKRAGVSDRVLQEIQRLSNRNDALVVPSQRLEFVTPVVPPVPAVIYAPPPRFFGPPRRCPPRRGRAGFHLHFDQSRFSRGQQSRFSPRV